MINPNSFAFIAPITIEKRDMESVDAFNERVNKTKDLINKNSPLTIREYFAVTALQGILSNASVANEPDFWAALSVKYADALIKELNQKQDGK